MRLNEAEKGWMAEPPKPFKVLKNTTVNSFRIGADGPFENFEDGSAPLYWTDSRHMMAVVFGVKRNRINLYVFISSDDNKSVEGYAKAISSYDQALKLAKDLALAGHSGKDKFKSLVEKEFRKDGNRTYAMQTRNRVQQIIKEDLNYDGEKVQKLQDAWTAGFKAGRKAHIFWN